MLSFIICETPKKFNHFKAIFGHFYPISLEKLAISPKTRIRLLSPGPPRSTTPWLCTLPSILAGW